jgi:hypothetical protein
MKKTVGAVVLSVGLLLGFGLGIIEVAYANWIGAYVGLPSITVLRDGSIVPETEFIKQVGNVYMLRYDMAKEYVVKINCSNIVFDGQGHCINGSMNFIYGGASQNYYSSGIYLEDVSNVTIRNVTICSFTKPCIHIYRCSKISVAGVRTDDICIEESSYNVISNCSTAIDSGSGLLIRSGSNNRIFRNSLALQVDSSNNMIYENNIAVSSVGLPTVGWGATNSWDTGAVGNYWSDYSGVDSNGNGIGDTPYVIDANNKDNYPLADKVVIPEMLRVVATPPPSISIASPENRVYNATSISLNFSINKPISNISYSLDGQENVAIAGNTTLSELANGSHNVKIYATDDSGNTGVSDIDFTVAVPEPESFPNVPVAVALTVVVISFVGLTVYFKKHKR